MYLTKGEFIQTLKDYRIIKDKIKNLRCEYAKIEYLRFNKVKSPLDYEIIGYKDNETIRALKERSYINPDIVSSNNEKLEKEMLIIKDKLKKCELTIKNCEYVLNKLSKPIRYIIIDRFINKKTYKELAKKYNKHYQGVIYPNTILRDINKALDEYFKGTI